MLVIHFDNGETLVGTFEGQHSSNMGGSYRLSDSYSLTRYRLEISFIRLNSDINGNKAENSFWFPIGRIVKFRELDDNEVKEFQRNEKLEEIVK